MVVWCKFQLFWTKIEGADTFGVKYLKITILSVFYKRFYRNRELQNAITFEQNRILTFCKNLLFSLMEIFQISPTWIMTMKTDQIPFEEAKIFEITHLANSLIFENTTCWLGNITTFCGIIKIDFRNRSKWEIVTFKIIQSQGQLILPWIMNIGIELPRTDESLEYL